ncbi:MAG: copper oxidase [Phycisphaeraceae bacterium]|nr:copper oxidase [Phycisphaeraceae bacterium]
MNSDKPEKCESLSGKIPLSRRDMLTAGAFAGGALMLSRRAQATPDISVPAESNRAKRLPAAHTDNSNEHFHPGEPGRDYTPVVVPNGWTLPYQVVDGVKVFHLVAEEVEHEFAPGLKATCWGYNGGVHGPVIEAVEGDRVRIFVTNKLSAPTTVHWHGVLLPSGMDGVGGLTQKAILPGETYMYEFPLRQHGTLMYHSHHDEMTQMGMGMTGLFIIHPRNPQAPRPDRDFALMLHEWKIEVGASRPDPNEMTDFNTLTINAKCFPGTQPLIVKTGDRVRIRIGNLSAMDHHPIHLHGYYFTVTETDGGVIPEAGRWPETTVLVATGSTRTVEFVADNPGDWAMHCHMTHHVMNQMGHGIPNMIGVDARGLDKKVRGLLPGYMTMGQDGMGGMTEMGMEVPPNSIPMVGGIGPYDEITMGGMFTILKVRDNIANLNEDPGWYEPPVGTLALPATTDSLQKSGITADGHSAPRAPAEAMKSWTLPPPLQSVPANPHHHGH